MGIEGFKDVPSFLKEKKKPEKKGGVSGARKDKVGIKNYYSDPSDKKKGNIKKKSVENNDGLKDKRKRNFLKAFMYGAGALATGVGVKELLDDGNGKGVEKKSVQKEEPSEANEEQEEDEKEGVVEEEKEHVVDRFERSIEKWKKSERADAIKKIKPQENMSPEDIAKEFLRLFEDKKEREELLRFFPAEVFETDFFMAQQNQESRGKKEAVSDTGARGVYQNFPNSVIDCVRYLNDMRNKGLIPYRGPSSIDRKTAKKVINYFTKNVNYGRAAGKIYLQAIYNPVSTYNSGKNSNVFRGKSQKDMQGRLLGSYHDGPSSRYKEDDALIAAAKKRAKKSGKKYNKRDSAIHYRETVFGYMDDLKLVRKIYSKLDFKLQFEDTAADKMLHVFEKYGKKSKREDLIIKFKDILKLEKDKKNRDLTRGEIIDIFRPYVG